MPKINVLPKHIADLIAAGEVVDRPSSVVKEAVENSIDAGSTKITVEIKHGGITYIRITDDGCGIMHDDIRNAFVSHATSKLTNADDLSAIGTLGFRGEALASVSAVARVEVMTKSSDETVGTHYCIEGGEEKSLGDVGCPDGTTLVVRDLFYNTPARMKFLKKDVSEANAVAGVIDRIALSHPEISIRFIRDGKETLLTSGDGKLLSSIYAVYGKEFANGLVPIEYELKGIKVKGYISKPMFSRPNRSMQIFFINGRLVQTKTGSVALSEAYKNSIMVGKFPACAINISLANETVDVNVHPSKLEVRFANEKAVYDCIYYGVKTTLSEKDTRPQVDLSKIAVQPVFTEPKGFEQIKISEKNTSEDFWQNKSAKEYSTFRDKNNSTSKIAQPPVQYGGNGGSIPIFSSPKVTVFEQKKNVKEEIGEETTPVLDSEPEKVLTEKEEKPLPDFKIVGEAFKTYIFAECDGKLLLIDKHAAHERIIYEQLKKNEDSINSQILLSPVTVTLSKEEFTAITDNIEMLAQAGYAVEEFGTGTVLVRECPAVLSQDDVEQSIMEIAGYLAENKKDIITEKIDWIFHSASCRAAIKAGDKTDRYELEKFVGMLLSDDSIRYCPHGRPVLAELTRKDLEKFFGRIQ